MSDGTKVIGRRVRYYQRADPGRPGQQERRARAAIGQRWCRGCAQWLPAGTVERGVCRVHAAAAYRRHYAANPEPIRQRVYARKRRIAPLPLLAIEILTELFEGQCAYCPAPATTWDHIKPVSRGGCTEPGNIVPACVSCNSSKKASDVAEWLRRTGREPHPAFFDTLALAA